MGKLLKGAFERNSAKPSLVPFCVSMMWLQHLSLETPFSAGEQARAKGHATRVAAQGSQYVRALTFLYSNMAIT